MFRADFMRKSYQKFRNSPQKLQVFSQVSIVIQFQRVFMCRLSCTGLYFIWNTPYLTLNIFRAIIWLSALTEFRFTSTTTIWATRIAWTRSLTTIVILITFKSTSRVQSTQLVTVVKSQHTMLGAIIGKRFIPKSVIHVSYTLITYGRVVTKTAIPLFPNIQKSSPLNVLGRILTAVLQHDSTPAFHKFHQMFNLVKYSVLKSLGLELFLLATFSLVQFPVYLFLNLIV